MEYELAITEAIYWVIRFIQCQVYGCLVLFTLDNLTQTLKRRSVVRFRI